MLNRKCLALLLGGFDSTPVPFQWKIAACDLPWAELLSLPPNWKQFTVHSPPKKHRQQFDEMKSDETLVGSSYIYIYLKHSYLGITTYKRFRVDQSLANHHQAWVFWLLASWQDPNYVEKICKEIMDQLDHDKVPETTKTSRRPQKKSLQKLQGCRFVPYTFSETRPRHRWYQAGSKYWWNQGLAAWFRAKSTSLKNAKG